MKRISVILLCGILFAGLTVSYAGTIASGYEVGTWRGFKSAAITFSLDDGCAKQLPVALPLFNQYNFNVTLFTVTNWVSSWSALQSAANQGHEIGSHTVTHLTLSTASTADQTAELTNSQNIINTNITTQKCRTIAYPNCTGGTESLCSQYYIAGRTCSGSINSNTPSNFYALSSFICGSEGTVATLSDFTAKASAAASSNGWCVYLIHGIDDDGGYSPLSSTILSQSLAYFNTNSSTYWVSTFYNVARYIKERNDVSVTVTSSTTNSISLTMTDNLDNTIYNYPLTLRRALPTGWTSAIVTQNGSAVSSSIVTNGSTSSIMFDVVPDAGAIVLLNPAANTIGQIDVNTKYQTMDGFGGGITWGNNYLHTNSSKNAIYDALFSDLGVSIVRIRNVYGRSDLSTIDYDRQTFVAAKARNSNIKFLMSSWSPPADLKDNGSVLGNGDNSNATLKYTNGAFVYDAFASYWLTSFNTYVSSGLSTIDYISIQNEPDYDASWEACRLRPTEEVYNGKRIAGYNTCLDKVYAQLGASTKFLGPEATGVVNNKVQDFVDVLDQSKLAVVAHHLYNGGDTANPDAYSANMQAMAAKYPDKKIWQTEFDQCSPFKTAWLMNNCIVDGRASAFLHWKLIWLAPDNRALIAVNNGSGYNINKYYYYFKQFSKYISAGYKRIAATSGSSDIKMSAFLNPANTQMTIVLINKGATALTMALTTGGYPITSSAIYRTSSSENFASIGALGSGNTISLPAQSVSTIIASIPINTYTISASAGANGSISPSGSTIVGQGSSQTYTITPASGYSINNVLVDGASIGSVSSYTFSNVTANHTIEAAFAIAPLTLTSSAGSGGSIAPSGTIPVQSGATQTFTITPSTGYEIASVLVDGVNAGTSATYTFSSISASHTISATFSSLTKYQINCGGSASSPYIADQYYSGGTAYSVTSAITTTGVTNPAPLAVYQTERFGAMTYTLPNLTSGASYTVRLHFSENYLTATGKRKFNVAINGTTVLSNYDIYAETAARYKAVVKEYIAIANASGQIVIAFANVTDNAKIDGIEIIKLITNAAPTIATPASATPSPVTGTTVALSALGADDNGESSLAYTWATTATPPAAVTFSANGTNAAKASTATFIKSGAYTFQVTIRDAGGLTVTSSISVTVNQTLTTINVSPSNATVNAATTQQFAAVARDQFGTSLVTQPTFTWSASEGGIISENGLFIAGATTGTGVVTATSGSVSGTASFTVNVGPTVATEASVSQNPVTTTSAALSALGADDNGESNLTYTWTTIGTPPAAVIFSPNGTNAAKAATAIFSVAGTYTFQVTITDQGNLTATSTVSVIVDQTLTAIIVSPGSATINTGATQQFTAVGRDQFAIDLTTQPAFTWAVSGSGTIDANGLFSAGTTAGVAVITASSGSVSGTAGVTIVVPNAAPTISSAASATPNPVTNKTTTLSVLGEDDNGESNLTYTWAIIGTPPAAVSFSANGANAAKNTTATFTKAGSYAFLVTIKDAGNLTATSSVSVMVNQTLTTITLSPTSASIATSATQQFTASGFDQFSFALSMQPTFTWSVSGGGTINTSGLYSAGTTAGTATVSAASGSVNGTASVTVTPVSTIVYQINCGGSASSPYTADQYYSGGTARTVTNTITTTGVINPAPQAVYKAERYGAVTYTLPSLTIGASYLVRLHFAELYWTATGKRKFNVAINGTTVLSNYDIYSATGAQYKAVVKEFTVAANSSGQIVIKLSNVTDNATIEGIQIIKQ
jgi:O-glycosyl hydrolase